MLPDKNSGYTLTLNVQDKEYIDLCAVSHDGQNCLITTERGFSEETVDSYRRLPLSLLQKDFVITVRITSSTAAPRKRRFRFLQTATTDHRIVESID
jgi:hypothetical protein